MNDMFCYELGYSSYEECPIKTILHTKKFTTDEFDEMVVESYIKSSKEAEIKHNIWYNDLPNETPQDRIEIEYSGYYPRVSDLYDRVVEIMIDEYGFILPVFTASFVVSDTEDIMDSHLILTGDHAYRSSRTMSGAKTSCDKLNLIRDRFNVIEPRDNKIDDILNG